MFLARQLVAYVNIFPYKTIKLAFILYICSCYTLLYTHDSLSLPSTEPEISLQYPEGYATNPCPKPYETISHSHVLFFK
jgi:hypothetical protein